MNKSIRLALISASVVAVGHAAPFMAVGDGAELFATGVVGVRADDNIFLSNVRTSDAIFDFTPGVELDFGKNSQAQGSLTLADDFVEYSQHSGLNTNLFSGDFVARFDDAKTKIGFNAGYHELNQNTVDIRTTNGRLVRRDITNAGLNAEIGISEISAIGGAVNFTHENYHPVDFVDSDTTTIPLNYYYKWTPKVDLSAGYQFRDYQAKSGLTPNSTDDFYNIGARGEFTPKLTGTFRVGYTQRRFDQGSLSNQNLFGLDGSFAYEVTPKTTVQLGVSNDFGTSPQGQQQKNLTANAVVSTKLTEEFSVNAGLSYRGISYYGVQSQANRTDDYWEATFGGAYVVSANVRIVGAYVYRRYNTDIIGSEFENNVISIAANFRY